MAIVKYALQKTQLKKMDPLSTLLTGSDMHLPARSIVLSVYAAERESRQ